MKRSQRRNRFGERFLLSSFARITSEPTGQRQLLQCPQAFPERSFVININKRSSCSTRALNAGGTAVNRYLSSLVYVMRDFFVDDNPAFQIVFESS